MQDSILSWLEDVFHGQLSGYIVKRFLGVIHITTRVWSNLSLQKRTYKVRRVIIYKLFSNFMSNRYETLDFLNNGETNVRKLRPILY